MKSLAACVVILTLASAAWAGDDSKSSTVQIHLNGHNFTLPAGFEIEQVAGPPLVLRPIVADFDEQGRLYVADSSGSNDPVAKQLQEKPHRIVRLEDTNGDGRFDRATVFADKMMFPEGVMWYDGSIYVGAPPSVWKLTDTKGTGVADQRSEWFQAKTLTGCANDLHGPYLGPDGWIYWCKGAFAKQTYPRPGRKPLVTSAAHIFRCRPDGTGVEPVMTGGMDNPVTVVFTPGGERIFTTTFLQSPGGGHRDGLIHAIYGGIYGKENKVNYDHPWTSPSLMPVLVHMGPAAPAGLVRYESGAFGKEFQDNLFACLFNMHKVTRHVLEPSGATFKTRDEDFLVSDNYDFHPTCVLEDADGSLLVLDTGGWYKICCPTSQLHKPDILGAIYRIRKKGMPHVEDPRGLKVAWDKLSARELGGLFEDQRAAVRHRAMQTLARKGTDALTALADVLQASESRTRCCGVWTATQIGDERARALVRDRLNDADDSVAQVAIHSVSLNRDRQALPVLVEQLKSSSLHHRRAAAEALGRLGDVRAVPALLEASGQPVDRILEHSLIYALIEIANPETTRAGLASSNPSIRLAALIALDQMEDGKLTAETILPLLSSEDPRTKGTAAWIVGRHPEWGNALAAFLGERLANGSASPAEAPGLASQLARLARSPAVQRLLAERVADDMAANLSRWIALTAMSQSGMREAPRSWIESLTKVLAVNDGDLVQAAIAAARALPKPKVPPPELHKALLGVALDSRRDATTRLAALAALPDSLNAVDPDLFRFLLANIDREQPVANRGLAADNLARCRLSREQLVTLIDSLNQVGPMEIDRVVQAFATCNDEQVGSKLVSALRQAPSRTSLRVDSLKQHLAKFTTPVQRQAEELYAALDADAVKQRAHLEDLLTTLKDGDVRRGQAVFKSAKAACSSCHAVGYMGGNIGPDLTRIGSIRGERDLLESIVFPSASFVRSYEPVIVMTKKGKQYNGLVRKDTLEELVLATGANEDARIARDDIDDIQPSKVSVMPSGLDQQLSKRDLADLVAFLKACK
jgi:putative membrane-bound dehydrogenase-like protein